MQGADLLDHVFCKVHFLEARHVAKMRDVCDPVVPRLQHLQGLTSLKFHLVNLVVVDSEDSESFEWDPHQPFDPVSREIQLLEEGENLLVVQGSDIFNLVPFKVELGQVLQEQGLVELGQEVLLKVQLSEVHVVGQDRVELKQSFVDKLQLGVGIASPIECP